MQFLCGYSPIHVNLQIDTFQTSKKYSFIVLSNNSHCVFRSRFFIQEILFFRRKLGGGRDPPSLPRTQGVPEKILLEQSLILFLSE